jgi:hypothetical protein
MRKQELVHKLEAEKHKSKGCTGDFLANYAIVVSTLLPPFAKTRKRKKQITFRLYIRGKILTKYEYFYHNNHST